MSTIVVTLIIIALIISVWVIFVSIGRRIKEMNNQRILDQFRKNVMNNNLSISSQEFLENALIGLDGTQRKLLIIRKNKNDGFDSFIIDLKHVNACSVRTIYSIKKISGRKGKLAKKIDKVILYFKTNKGAYAEIPFFDRRNDRVSELNQLERKAEKWESILLKFIDSGDGATAREI